MIRCDIYKGSKKAEMFLYVPSDRGLQDVPEALLTTFGDLKLVMSLLLTNSRKLARVDSTAVIAELQQKGFYLQMPPSNWTDTSAKD